MVSLNDLNKKNESLETFELVPFIDQTGNLDPAYLHQKSYHVFYERACYLAKKIRKYLPLYT
jgi:hypothetical protein